MITNKGNFKTKQITMTQQTAVEWLLEQIRLNKLTFYNEGDNRIPITLVGGNIVEKAKQMEKEQIIDAYTIGSYDMAEKEFRPEEYYNETYNK